MGQDNFLFKTPSKSWTLTGLCLHSLISGKFIAVDTDYRFDLKFEHSKNEIWRLVLSWNFICSFYMKTNP